MTVTRIYDALRAGGFPHEDAVALTQNATIGGPMPATGMKAPGPASPPGAANPMTGGAVDPRNVAPNGAPLGNSVPGAGYQDLAKSWLGSGAPGFPGAKGGPSGLPAPPPSLDQLRQQNPLAYSTAPDSGGVMATPGSQPDAPNMKGSAWGTPLPIPNATNAPATNADTGTAQTPLPMDNSLAGAGLGSSMDSI